MSEDYFYKIEIILLELVGITSDDLLKQTTGDKTIR